MIIRSGWELKTDFRDVVDSILETKVFTRQIDVILVGIAIGINKDTYQEQAGEKNLSVPYNTLNNSEINDTVSILFESAILSSSESKRQFDEAQRLQLAFDPDFEIEGFSKTRFILGFASYGIKYICEEIYNKSPEIFYNNLKNFFIIEFEEINFKNLNLLELSP